MDSNCADRKEYCDNRLNDLRRLMCTKFLAHDKAVEVARSEMGRWMEGHNEFRMQLKDQAATMLDIRAYAADQKVVLKEIEILREWKANVEGAKSWSNILAGAAVLISMAIGVLHFFSTMKG